MESIIDLLLTALSERPSAKAIIMSYSDWMTLLNESAGKNRPIRLGPDIFSGAIELKFMNVPIFRTLDLPKGFYVIG